MQQRCWGGGDDQACLNHRFNCSDIDSIWIGSLLPRSRRKPLQCITKLSKDEGSSHKSKSSALEH